MAVSHWNKILEEKGHRNSNIAAPDSPLARHLQDTSRPVETWTFRDYFAPGFTSKLRRFVKNENVDVVVLQSLRDLWIVTPALWNQPQCQLIGFTQMLLDIKKTDPLHRLVYSRLNHLLTLTDWQQEALAPYLPVAKHKYKTVPNFVDCQRFHPDKRSDQKRSDLGYTSSDFVIGLIGRIDQQKGQLELVQAFGQIQNDFPQAKLLIVGEPTKGEASQEAYYSELQSWVKDHKLETKVQFRGFTNTPEQLMANLDLFVLASHQETFGYVVIEAMASGTPVLGTEAGGVPEILSHGKLGFLCQPKSSQSMAEQLGYILSNPSEVGNKKKSALHRARDFYDRQMVYQNLMEVLGLPK